MTDENFGSVLSQHLTNYVSLRRSLGFELRTQVRVLRQFDRVVQQEMLRLGPVTQTVVEAFLRGVSLVSTPIRVDCDCPSSDSFCSSCVWSSRTRFIPDRSLEPARTAPRAPHIYTDTEIQALVLEARRFPLRYGCRQWIIYSTLITFLYATGVRISEALALNLEDIDWRQAVVRIRKTKFHKARLVPLTQSSCAAIQHLGHHREPRRHGTRVVQSTRAERRWKGPADPPPAGHPGTVQSLAARSQQGLGAIADGRFGDGGIDEIGFSFGRDFQTSRRQYINAAHDAAGGLRMSNRPSSAKTSRRQPATLMR